MATPVVVKCEVAWGANLAAAPGTWTWTDITADFFAAAGVTITTGRGDESSQSQPTLVGFTLLDSSPSSSLPTKYVPRNPLGLNYPYVRQNTPFRLTLAGGVRAIVYADSWAPSWDESLKRPIVAVSASGVLRRLGQGKTPTTSSLYRTITEASPVAYWPLEDASGSTMAASAVQGGLPLTVTPWGSITATPQFGSVAGPGGSGQLPNFTTAAALGAFITAAQGASTPWSFGCAVKVPAIGAGQTVMLMRIYTTGSVWYWDLQAYRTADGGVILGGTYANSNSTFQINTNQGIDDGNWHWIKVDAAQSGADINVNVYIDGVLAGGALGWPATLTTKTLGAAGSILVNQTQPNGLYPMVGHVALWNGTSVADQTASMNGYAGETATARLARLCAEQGVPITITGSSITVMGVQPLAAFMDLVRACEAADGGILTDGGSNGGLTYLARAARYNQSAAFTLDNNMLQLARPFAPVEDDQRRRNDVTVSRTSGSSGRYVDASGPQGTAAVGTYADSTTLNVSSDSVLVDQAAWRVHLGTAEAMRYSPVVLNLRARTELVTAWLATAVGSRFTLRNLPAQHAPGDVDLIVEGWTEHCDGMVWTVSINSSPYDPWRVLKIGDAKLGRLDTGGSTLNSSATAAATSLSVATSVLPLWTTTATFPADFPFDIDIEGEQITVTAISGSSSPQTFTVTRAVNGVSKAHASAATVKLWKPAVLGL